MYIAFLALCQPGSVNLFLCDQPGPAQAPGGAGQLVGRLDRPPDQLLDQVEAGIDLQDEGGVHEAGGQGRLQSHFHECHQVREQIISNR